MNKKSDEDENSSSDFFTQLEDLLRLTANFKEIE